MVSGRGLAKGTRPLHGHSEACHVSPCTFVSFSWSPPPSCVSWCGTFARVAAHRRLPTCTCTWNAHAHAHAHVHAHVHVHAHMCMHMQNRVFITKRHTWACACACDMCMCMCMHMLSTRRTVCGGAVWPPPRKANRGIRISTQFQHVLDEMSMQCVHAHKTSPCERGVMRPS